MDEGHSGRVALPALGDRITDQAHIIQTGHDSYRFK